MRQEKDLYGDKNSKIAIEFKSQFEVLSEL